MNHCQFSDCRRYRYVLRHIWEPSKPPLVVIGLNPSTADEEKLDPTLRRCVDYAKRWECGSLRMLNLFAFRATQPEDMKRQSDPIGPENYTWLIRETNGVRLILAAWGNHGQFKGRDIEVLDLMQRNGRQLSCLWRNGDGTPKHPLYCAKKLTPIPYSKKFIAERSDF